MFQVYNCLTDQHDWRLVGVAAVICFFASLTTISIFNRARATRGRSRVVWIVAAGVAAGFGIWATHFVAMLAYEPGITIAYGLTLTVTSLAAAAVTVSLALAVGVYLNTPWAASFSGALVGGGIATMHYIGMSAVSIPGLITWRIDLVVASIVLGMLFGALAMAIAVRSQSKRNVTTAAMLLTLAIVSHHFTAMGAVQIVPDPTRGVGALSISPGVMAVAVASVAMAILGISLVSAFAGRRLHDTSSYLALALNNMTQGVVMFDESERLVACNRRYIDMYGLSRDVVKPGLKLVDLIRSRHSAGNLAVDAEQYCRDILKSLDEKDAPARLIETPDGRAISVVNRRIDGRKFWIGTHDDITERLEAERKGAAMVEQERRRTEVESEIRAFRENAEALLRTAAESTRSLKAIAVTLSQSSASTSKQTGEAVVTSNEASSNMSAAAAAAEEMVASIGEIGRQVGQAAELVAHSVNEARNANEQMAQLTDAVQEIGDVVSLIRNIAGQTNLLALNATIEAARAGEAGRGFAVVATEVKTLAVQTAKATEQIAVQIETVQNSTRLAVDAIRRTTDRMKEIDGYTSAVAVSVVQQNSTTDEISRNLSNAVGGAKVIVTALSEVTNAVANSQQAAAEVLEVSKSVEAATAGLEDRIAGFLRRVAI